MNNNQMMYQNYNMNMPTGVYPPGATLNESMQNVFAGNHYVYPQQNWGQQNPQFNWGYPQQQYQQPGYVYGAQPQQSYGARPMTLQQGIPGYATVNTNTVGWYDENAAKHDPMYQSINHIRPKDTESSIGVSFAGLIKKEENTPPEESRYFHSNQEIISHPELDKQIMEQQKQLQEEVAKHMQFLNQMSMYNNPMMNNYGVPNYNNPYAGVMPQNNQFIPNPNPFINYNALQQQQQSQFGYPAPMNMSNTYMGSLNPMLAYQQQQQSQFSYPTNNIQQQYVNKDEIPVEALSDTPYVPTFVTDTDPDSKDNIRVQIETTMQPMIDPVADFEDDLVVARIKAAEDRPEVFDRLEELVKKSYNPVPNIDPVTGQSLPRLTREESDEFINLGTTENEAKYFSLLTKQMRAAIPRDPDDDIPLSKLVRIENGDDEEDELVSENDSSTQSDTTVQINGNPSVTFDKTTGTLNVTAPPQFANNAQYNPGYEQMQQQPGQYNMNTNIQAQYSDMSLYDSMMNPYGCRMEVNNFMRGYNTMMNNFAMMDTEVPLEIYNNFNPFAYVNILSINDNPNEDMKEADMASRMYGGGNGTSYHNFPFVWTMMDGEMKLCPINAAGYNIINQKIAKQKEEERNIYKILYKAASKNLGDDVNLSQEELEERSNSFVNNLYGVSENQITDIGKIHTMMNSQYYVTNPLTGKQVCLVPTKADGTIPSFYEKKKILENGLQEAAKDPYTLNIYTHAYPEYVQQQLETDMRKRMYQQMLRQNLYNQQVVKMHNFCGVPVGQPISLSTYLDNGWKFMVAAQNEEVMMNNAIKKYKADAAMDDIRKAKPKEMIRKYYRTINDSDDNVENSRREAVYDALDYSDYKYSNIFKTSKVKDDAMSKEVDNIMSILSALGNNPTSEVMDIFMDFLNKYDIEGYLVHTPEGRKFRNPDISEDTNKKINNMLLVFKRGVSITEKFRKGDPHVY